MRKNPKRGRLQIDLIVGERDARLWAGVLKRVPRQQASWIDGLLHKHGLPFRRPGTLV